jgi:ABC-type transport system involved in multi-copper enzyme maturation permease subunit
MTLWPVALITFKEGIRNKALYGITLIALILFGATALIATMIPREVGKVSIDMVLSAISFTGLLLVFFVGINLMAKDLDKRTIYTILSRPISRSQYIFGKFLGMALFIIVTMSALSLMAMAAIVLLKTTHAEFFVKFSWALIMLAILFNILMLILLSAISFFFASFTTSSFITLVLTIITYIIGQSISGVKALVESSPQEIGFTVSPVTLNMVKAAYYLFPNLSLFDIKLQASHALTVSSSFVLWTVIYGIVYIALTITLAALIFRKKEFP